MMAIYVDDRELVAAHQAGDSGAFDELVREHRVALVTHARRKLHCDAAAEDAVQETLVRAYRALPRFNGEYRLGPWLNRIMANVCVDEVNRRQRDGEKVDRYAAQPAVRGDAPSVEDELRLDFDDGAFHSALGELSDPYREALVLRFVEDLGYDQVAAVSGVSEQNARARVSRARSAIRAALKGVATLPLLLLGLMKRGEKAAAAATSTAGAVSATAGSTATNAAAVVASQAAPALPTLAEATVAASHAAPTLVPVIAKAAVGIGLVAAVLTPTSDSAVHQAVENMVSGSAGVVVGELLGEPISVESSPVVIVTPVEGQVLETLSPSSEVVVSDATNDNLSSVAESSVGGSIESVVTGVAGTITASELQVSVAGRGQYGMAGTLIFSTDNGIRDGELKDATRIRIAPEEGADGRQRLDAVLVAEFADGTEAEVRLVGFARDMDAGTQISGLYRSITPGIDLAEQGSFAGVIGLDHASTEGVLSITLAP
jgi:RNA polymerase sigma-70 factor (ECF subfamily)